MRLLTAESYFEALCTGDRLALSRAITLVESTTSDKRKLGEEIVRLCLKRSGSSIRVGLSGSPGAGKSTLIEALGLMLIEKGHRIAVLAIDPTSELTGGSILGDKTRMTQLSKRTEAYIRPTASSRHLGGVAPHTRETILLCEAAGYDIVFIETVGVGQGETQVQSMSDVFVLLQIPGAGDDLQGIKKGIIEAADVIAVNKSDEDREGLATQSRRNLAQALHLLPPRADDWKVPIVQCSALHGFHLDTLWEHIQEFIAHQKDADLFHVNRLQQRKAWISELVHFHLNRKAEEALSEAMKVDDPASDPFETAKRIMNDILHIDQSP